ncbi:MAG: 2-oxoacid:acceptor oxidoreductase family protein [Dehalococcoidia bacterium]|nr:2-oxoacid:acceptor oxidoreductase family protein [Dehalococcoidia bacterium]
MQRELVFSGVGGQGILIGSQLFGHTALAEGKRAMYFSMFQGAQRGGICECLLVVADGRVEASPVIMQPLDGCIAMHPNSFLRFEPLIDPGGLLVYNTSIKFGTSDTKMTSGEGLGMKADTEITLNPQRTDIAYFGLPATDLAVEQLGNSLQATLITLGAFINLSQLVSLDAALKALPETLPSHRRHLTPVNEKALQLGYDYASPHRADLQNAGALSLLGQGLAAATA